MSEAGATELEIQMPYRNDDWEDILLKMPDGSLIGRPASRHCSMFESQDFLDTQWSPRRFVFKGEVVRGQRVFESPPESTVASNNELPNVSYGGRPSVMQNVQTAFDASPSVVAAFIERGWLSIDRIESYRSAMSHDHRFRIDCSMTDKQAICISHDEVSAMARESDEVRQLRADLGYAERQKDEAIKDANKLRNDLADAQARCSEYEEAYHREANSGVEVRRELAGLKSMDYAFSVDASMKREREFLKSFGADYDLVIMTGETNSEFRARISNHVSRQVKMLKPRYAVKDFRLTDPVDIGLCNDAAAQRALKRGESPESVSRVAKLPDYKPGVTVYGPGYDI